MDTGKTAKRTHPSLYIEDFIWLYTEEEFAAWLGNLRERKAKEKGKNE